VRGETESLHYGAGGCEAVYAGIEVHGADEGFDGVCDHGVADAEVVRLFDDHAVESGGGAGAAEEGIR
jgi:hypothetical protein